MSHDLRQPLTCLTLNLETAIELLRKKDPNVGLAIAALSDCLLCESDILQILQRLRRRAVEPHADTAVFALNGLANDVIVALNTMRHCWVGRVDSALRDPSPLVHRDAAALRFVLLSLVRRAIECSITARLRPTVIRVGTSLDGDETSLRVAGIPLLAHPPRVVAIMLHTTHGVATQIGGRADVQLRGEATSLVITLPCVSTQ